MKKKQGNRQHVSEQARLDKFMTARFMHDSINRALAKAKTLGFSDADCQPIVIEKLKNLQIYKDMLSLITTSALTNVVRFGEGWFGIICVTRGKPDLIVYPFKPEVIDNLEVNFAVTAAQPRAVYDELTKTAVNFEIIDDYRNRVARERDAILAKILNFDNIILRGKRQFAITSHCVDRWLERVDCSSAQLNAVNRCEVIRRMTASFRRATNVYTYVDGSSTFYLDPKLMIFYAVSADDVILSLWVNSYGFTEQTINASSTLLQVVNARQRQINFRQVSAEVSRKTELVNTQLVEIDGKLGDVDARIAELQAWRDELLERRTKLTDDVQRLKAIRSTELSKLTTEENLLFRDHRKLTESEATVN